MRSFLPHLQTAIIAAAMGLVGANAWTAEESASEPITTQVSFRKSNQSSKRLVGSAKRLEGIVYIYNVFVSDDHSTWSKSGKNEAKQRMRSAFDFIANQSMRHGKEITFVEEYAADIHLTNRVPRDAHANPTWTEVAFQQASGLSATRLVERIQSESRPDNVILCLHVNKRALSYNLAFYEGVSDRYSAERMVCFADYPDGRQTSAATYAHEILHLFGAGDLYFPYDEESIRKERASRIFPNDVMFRVDYDLQSLDVGAFTAYRVGWIDELDPKWVEFQD